MDQLAALIDRVSKALDAGYTPTERRLDRRDWNPILGTRLQSLAWALKGGNADRHRAQEARREYERFETDTRKKRSADADAAERELARAREARSGARPREVERPETARRWARRSVELRIALSVGDTLRRMSDGEALAAGLPQECLAAMRAIEARNVYEARLLTSEVLLDSWETWYSKITGLIGPHNDGGCPEDRSLREFAIGVSSARRLERAAMELWNAEARRQREAGPTAEAIFDAWLREGKLAEHACRARSDWQAASFALKAEGFVVRMRSREALVDRVRADTRGLIDATGRRLAASMAALET